MFSIKRIFCFFALLLLFLPAKPQAYNDLQVSLLTVEPRSNAVYTIFGHTALRLYSPSRSIDTVLNWGTFDFDQPNFIFNFVLGKTDYFLSASSTRDFLYAYKAGNSTVIEQVLNIPDSLKMNLLNAMETNLQPENVGYRYNIFFDNCTTRARDIIEGFCGGIYVYPIQKESVTIRKLVHNYTKPYPWLEFGIDFVIGSGADSTISRNTEMFLPEKLMTILDQSVVRSSDGTEYQIVLSSKTILQSGNDEHTNAGSIFDDFTKPIVVTTLLFLCYLFLAIIGYREKRNFRYPFAFAFLLAGLGGCIIAEMVFFSFHPCTSPNWNLVWVHPLHLFAFAGFLFKKYYKLFRWYHAVNFVLLSCFLIAWHWIPQGLNTAAIPLAGCLWLVSGYQCLFWKRENDKNKG